MSDGMDADEIFEELCELRAAFAFRHACNGFSIDYEDAIELLRNTDDLTEDQKKQRDIIVAAFDNIVDFATAEEYQLISEFEELDADDEDGDEEDLDDEEQEEAILALCAKYNQRYATVENHDIEYAMIVAAELASLSEESYLMYMTMGDERVRPWHLQYEGFTAPKSQFPAWLIPPIEHNCRCYLLPDGKPSAHLKDIMATKAMLEPPFWLNKTFKESVALGGRIFSEEHPYFKVEEQHKDRLLEIAQKIKNKYYNA